MIALVIILILVLQAVSDGLKDSGRKTLSKYLECVYIVMFFVLAYLISLNNYTEKEWYVFNTGMFYLFMRIAIFDLSYNITTRLPLNFVGTTSGLYDYLMSKLKSYGFWVLRGWFLLWAILVYIYKL